MMSLVGRGCWVVLEWRGQKGEKQRCKKVGEARACPR